jgi:ribosomal protein S27E
MVNSEFIKDVKKGLEKNKINQVLDPGVTPRRYEPNGGISRHNNRIHKESKYADEYKNLPFSFRKPPKAKGRPTYVKCDNCGHITSGSSVTVGIICKECNTFSTVTEVVLDR